MMKKVILKRVFITDQSKDGTKFISKKTGKSFWKIGIQIDEYGDKWLTGFINQLDDPMREWKNGDEVFIKVEQNGDWLNFSRPTNFDFLKEKVLKLEQRVSLLEGRSGGEQVTIKKEEKEQENFPF